MITQSFIKHRGDILSKHIFVAAKLLTKAGWQVSVLAPHERDLACRERIEGVEISRFKYFLEKWERLAYTGRMQELVAKNPANLFLFLFFMFFFALRASQIAKRTRPLLLHAHWWIPTGVLGCLVSRLRNIPLLVTLHGTDVRLINRNFFFSFLARRVFKYAAAITVVSDFIKQQLISRLDVPPDKVFVLPMPIDPEKIYETEVPPSERKMILCVARLTTQKDLGTLIRAFHRVEQKQHELDLVIIGEGPERANLQDLMRELDLEKEVFLYDLMPQETLNQYYNKCHMVVLPSVEEGFGLVMVEGQLCKKPVMGANSGGIPEIIEHEKTGLLFPPEDHQSLASAMERILADENFAFQLGEAGYQSAQTKFSQETFLRKYVEVLRWLQKKS
jgi:glycosyltransferase involved in cell wall biosynthesis